MPPSECPRPLYAVLRGTAEGGRHARIEITVLLGLAMLVGTVLAPRLRSRHRSCCSSSASRRLHPRAAPDRASARDGAVAVPARHAVPRGVDDLLAVGRRSLRYITRWHVARGGIRVRRTPWSRPGWVCVGGRSRAGRRGRPRRRHGRRRPRPTAAAKTFMKLKAESLTNDGTALVLYAIAVALCSATRSPSADHRHGAAVVPRRPPRASPCPPRRSSPCGACSRP